MEDTDTVFDLTTESKELLLETIEELDIKWGRIINVGLLDTEINYLIKLVKNDLGVKNE